MNSWTASCVNVGWELSCTGRVGLSYNAQFNIIFQYHHSIHSLQFITVFNTHTIQFPVQFTVHTATNHITTHYTVTIIIHTIQPTRNTIPYTIHCTYSHQPHKNTLYSNCNYTRNSTHTQYNSLYNSLYIQPPTT
jgi:hypothetical protein